MKVLCIGKSHMEITCPNDYGSFENSYFKLTEKIECGGGTAGNIAYLLAKWGIESYIASMVGADDYATKIKKEYETIGVKTDYIETSYDKTTNNSLVLVNKTNKNKTVFEIDNNCFLKKYNFGIEATMVISDGYDYNATVYAYEKYSKLPSILVVNNVLNDTVELGKYVNYIVFGQTAAEFMTNIKIDYNNAQSLVNLYNSLKSKFNNAEIIVTLGVRGSLYSINGQVKIMPTVKKEVVDTNGSRDVYVGAFAYSIGRGFDLEKAVCYATIAASMSVTKYGSRTSIPALIEVSDYYKSKFGTINNDVNQGTQTNQVQVNPSNNEERL